MANETTLKESKNKVEIEGIVKAVNIEVKEIKGKNTILGSVDILVPDEKTGVDSIIQVNVYSTELNKKGEVSGLYKSYKTIMEEYKSIDVHGLEEADKVRTGQATIRRNEYIGQDGQLRSFPQISTTFLTRITGNDVFDPHATFAIDMYVSGKKMETKKVEGVDEETGRLILKGYLVGYQDQADASRKIYPVELIADNEKSVNYIDNNYEKGNTVSVSGKIINTRKETTKIIEADFGDDVVETTVEYVREYLITGGQAPKDEDQEYDQKAIKAALEAREKALKEKESASSNGSGGFGSGSGKKTEVKDDIFGDEAKPTGTKGRGQGGFVDISDDDLPF